MTRPTRTPRLARLLPVALAATALLAACSGSGAATASPTTAATAPAASPDTSAAASAEASAGAVTKVSANTATEAELIAALTGAGVPNPERWAREIQEYRPYDAADPTLTSLQQNLAKYQPSAETLAGILSVLEP
jgi:DNA uptake protein ComE-like DNA-binding protein